MKIYIVSHKAYNFPKNKIYSPIQVNANKNKDLKFDYKDNNGDNISDKNDNYCELTALYWIWKNSKEDIIGLVHYRRYFFEKTLTKKYEYLLNEEDIKKILSNKNIIISQKLYFRNYNVYDQYASLHNINDLNECKKIIEEKYPEYVANFENIMKRKYLYPYNMFIGKKEIMNNYFEWLFNILFELEKRIDITKYDKYNSRIYGFLSERLFNVWIDKNIDKDKIAEVFVNNIEENIIKQKTKNYINSIFN